MQVTHELAGDVDTVFGLMTDPGFLERKFTDSGAKDVSVEREDGADGGTTLVIRRRVTIDLPSFAAKFIQPTNNVVQTEQWAPATGDGSRRCTYRIEVQGVPSRIDGTVTLTPDGGNTRQQVDADVKVSIPLAGGRLEKLAVDSGRNLLRDEAEFTNRELASR